MLLDQMGQILVIIPSYSQLVKYWHLVLVGRAGHQPKKSVLIGLIGDKLASNSCSLSPALLATWKQKHLKGTSSKTFDCQC